MADLTFTDSDREKQESWSRTLLFEAMAMRGGTSWQMRLCELAIFIACSL